MMLFKLNLLTMANSKKVTRYHGKNFKNGWNRKAIKTFGLNLYNSTKEFVKIFYKVCDCPLQKNIQNIFLSIYCMIKSDNLWLNSKKQVR